MSGGVAGRGGIDMPMFSFGLKSRKALSSLSHPMQNHGLGV